MTVIAYRDGILAADTLEVFDDAGKTYCSKLHRSLFSSASLHWRTPAAVYAELDAEFHFNFDPCPLYGTGGLEADWRGRRVYCNPPYGRGTAAWLEKRAGTAVCVYLLPSRTDTRWWHEHAMKATEIRFLRGRLKFGGSKNNAPFPSVVLIFNEEKTHD